MPSNDSQAGCLKPPTYAPGAFCRNAIPQQKALETQDGFTRAVGGTDYLERLPWGDYAYLDIHVRPTYHRIYQERLASGKQYMAGGGAGPIIKSRRTL